MTPVSTQPRSSHKALLLPCMSVVGLLGCTALNASFNDRDVDASATGGELSSTTTALTTSDGTTEASDSDSSAPASSSTTAVAETDADTVADTGSGDPASTCDPYPGPLVNNILADTLSALCPGAVIVEQGLISMRGEVLEVTTCVECPGTCDGPVFTIDLDVAVDVPADALPDCGRLAMWGLATDAKSCDWLGMTLFDFEGHPLFAVSDRLSVPAAAGGMAATMVNRIPCDGTCTEDLQPGSYSLSMGGPPVPSGEEGTAMVAGASNTAIVVFENHAAVIGPQCEPQVSWVLDLTASR